MNHIVLFRHNQEPLVLTAATCELPAYPEIKAKFAKMYLGLFEFEYDILMDEENHPLILPDNYLTKKQYLEMERLGIDMDRFLQSGEMIFLTFTSDMQCVGYGKVCPCYFSSLFPNTATLRSLWIDPEYRDQGLGKEMMLYISQFLKDQKIAQLLVNVLSENRAASFYEQHGFRDLQRMLIKEL